MAWRDERRESSIQIITVDSGGIEHSERIIMVRYGPVGNVRRDCFAPTLPLFDVLIVLVSCAVLTLFQSFLL